MKAQYILIFYVQIDVTFSLAFIKDFHHSNNKNEIEDL